MKESPHVGDFFMGLVWLTRMMLQSAHRVTKGL